LKLYNKKDGFTLLELLVVIVLLLLIVSLTIFTLSKAQRKYTIINTANRLLLLLKKGRTVAIIKNRPVILKAIDEQHEVVLNFLSENKKAINSYILPATITIEMQPIVFYPTGSSSGGQIKLSDSKRRIIIKVNETTGIAKIYR